MLTVLQGDCREMLKTLSDESVHCCATSPPYWGLRDYGVDGQLGLEATPDEYVAKMVAVFREVRRVLRSDGVCFLNLGDSYAASGGGAHKDWHANPGMSRSSSHGGVPHGRVDGELVDRYTTAFLKPKDLVGIPWMVAFALRADGWYLRSEIIWAKPNPMPESVTDRPTKSHEQIFLLTKSARYFYDAEAIKESSVDPESLRPEGRNPRNADAFTQANAATFAATRTGFANLTGACYPTRNKRSVWTIATSPYSGSHFAVFPSKLIEPCILAGTSARGCCPECGAPWERIVERPPNPSKGTNTGDDLTGGVPNMGGNRQTSAGLHRNGANVSLAHLGTTTGWQPTCECKIIRCANCATVIESTYESERRPSQIREAPQVPRVRGSVSSLSQTSVEVLQPQMCGAVDDEETESAGAIHDDEGLRSDLPAESPTIYQSGLHNGAPPSNGEGDGTLFASIGSGASRKRKQERQPSSESRVDEQVRSRPDSETAASHGLAQVSSGTVGKVALELGRKAVLIELNPEYCKMIEKRSEVTLGLPGLA